MIQNRILAVEIMRRLDGTPYKFGGNDPADGGIDCSGAIRFALRICGIIPWPLDFTAKDFLRKFREYKVETPTWGCLAFYGENWGDVDHVMMCSDTKHVVGSAGKYVTWAGVQELPIDYRPDLLVCVDPFQETQ